MLGATIIVGRTGAGKTSFIKKYLRTLNLPIYIYDIQNEYYKNLKPPNFETFLSLVINKKNSIIILEDATTFLNNKSTNQNLIRLLVEKRHTKNLIFLVFHSLRAVPTYLIDLSDYLVLFKTNDKKTLINNKFKNDPSIIQLFNEVNENIEPFYYKILALTSR